MSADSILPWSARGVAHEKAVIAAQVLAAFRASAEPPFPQVLDARVPRDVAVGYTARGGGSYVGARVMPQIDVAGALAIILEDLAVDVADLRVDEIVCDGRRPVLMLHPAGCLPRVVAIVRCGLTELDLNLALLRLGPTGCAA